jgi:hypothetical protein
MTDEVKATIGQLAAMPSVPIWDITESVENFQTAKYHRRRATL